MWVLNNLDTSSSANELMGMYNQKLAYDTAVTNNNSQTPDDKIAALRQFGIYFSTILKKTLNIQVPDGTQTFS